MIRKKRYLEILVQNLDNYYDELKLKSETVKDQQQYINGYVNAAIDLGVLTFEELKPIIEKVHFKAFGKTIEERRKSESSESSSDSDYFYVPAYIRKGILLDKK